MNLLLFESHQLRDNKLIITGRQHRHLHQTLKLEPGESLRVGAIDGLMGRAEITVFDSDHTELNVRLDSPPPLALPLKLILALPRPKMMRRVLQTVASLGIKEIHLINSYRVEKSFWQTPWLSPEAIREQLLLGLEQCGDTQLPAVNIHKRFKPFVEDELPTVLAGTAPLLAHPYTANPCPVGQAARDPVSLVVGPEGGFIPYEVEKLTAAGCMPVTLGPRILRVEVAIPVLVSRLIASA